MTGPVAKTPARGRTAGTPQVRGAGLLIAIAVLLGGCGGPRIVDGGVVDRHGWPVRPADKRVRCPDGTFLLDDVSRSGRRTVTCRAFESANPRGFELTWNSEGILVSELALSADGTPQSRLQWFDDGNKSVEEIYKGGRLIRKLGYYQSGRVRADIAYDPTRDVTFVKRFSPDGSLEEEGEMRNGRLVGKWREWRDGALETLTYVDGVAQGEVVREYPAGGVERGQYMGGERDGKWIRLDDNDNPLREIEYVNGRKHGVFRLYHPNTQLREEGQYVDDQKHGQWKTWYPSGELASESWFSCGVPVGPYKTYHRDGKPELEGRYENGQKVGEWKTFTESGLATAIAQHGASSEVFDPKSLPQRCSRSL